MTRHSAGPETLDQLFTLQLIVQDTGRLQRSSLMPHLDSGKINLIPALTSVFSIWVACSLELEGTKGKGSSTAAPPFVEGLQHKDN